MTETKQKNPKKELAVTLAHMLLDQERLYNEDLPPWREEEIREYCSEVRNMIWKSGYNFDELMFLAEEYKTLSFINYREWIYN